MHLPVGSEDGAIRAEDDRGVVVEAAGPFLKVAGDEGDFQFFAKLAQKIRGGTGDGLREIKTSVVLFLAKIEGTKQLRQADKLGPLFGGGGDSIDGQRQVLLGIG